MKLRRSLAFVLSLVLMLGALPPVTLAAQEPQRAAAFTDIDDPTVKAAAELLRQLGVVSGDGSGLFYPDLPLTRAQFCRMAVDVKGAGAEAQAMMNYTFFSDVRGDHWARGYINYASRMTIGDGAERLVMGVGDGSFHPDDQIGFAQAVTMAIRLLGYSQKDVPAGVTWYDGYLSAARAIGLLEGLDATWDDSHKITRAEAALLFQNLLFTAPNGAGEPLFAALGGTVTGELLVLDTDELAADGSPAIAVAEGGSVAYYKKGELTFDPALRGGTVKLMLDGDGRIMAVETLSTLTQQQVTVAMAEASHILTKTNQRVDIPAGTTVYEGTTATTYAAVAGELTGSATLTLCTNAAGRLEMIFLDRGAATQGVGTTRTVTAARAEADYLLTDAGERLALAEDTVVYVAGEKTTYAAVYLDLPEGTALTLSYGADGRQEYLWIAGALDGRDIPAARITAIYRDAAPSPSSPRTVAILNVKLSVLDSAMDQVAQFQPGDLVTFLLTAEGKVAGALPAEGTPSTLVGMVVEGDASTATVTPVLPLKDVTGSPVTLTGSVSTSAAALVGQLVTVTSTRADYITLTRVSKSAAAGALDVTARTLDGEALSKRAVLYERTAGGLPQAIGWERVTLSAVPAAQISYVGRDEQGEINVLILDDVTGDGYTYGYAQVRAQEETYANLDGTTGSYSIYFLELTDSTAAPAVSLRTMNSTDFRKKTAAGVAPKADGTWLAAAVTLTELKGISRTAIDPEAMTITVDGTPFPVSREVQCYNRTAGAWFGQGQTALATVKAYARTVTVYYDKLPAQGGKIRMVVVG